jgi:hypothetical protein
MKILLALSLIAVCALLPARAQETAAMVGQLKALGATADGRHDDTSAIQKAIDKIHAAGGGSVLFPPGEYRLTGAGLNLRSKVILRGMDAISSRLIFDQADPTRYAINLCNEPAEYCPRESWIRDLRILTKGGGAVRDTPTAAADGIARGWLNGGIRDVVIEGGARGGYAVDLLHYSQGLLLENVRFEGFLGPALRIDGNVNVMRRVGPDSFAGWYADRHYENPGALAMISIAGDSNTLEDSTIEAFSGCPALKLTGYRHAVTRLWAETDGGPIPGAAWIVLDDAHHVLFDWPHLLNPGTQKLVMRNSDAVITMLEPKHLEGSLDLDAGSSLTVLVPARGMPPGVHVVETPNKAN